MSGALARLADSAPSLRLLLPSLVRAAASTAPVMILGEAGSGRSAVARALHADSPRGTAPLVEVDTGAIPATLFESELFGYRAGAFTGAERTYPGRIERAERGTLLLDHVEELPLGVQPKLLRVLSEQRYAPLGGDEVGADVRILSVASADLPRRVESGEFRDDLYWRLEVVTFRLTPLRERPGDVLPIAEAMLADLAARFGRPKARLAPRALEWMPTASWPGNLRQLRNVLERTLLASRRELVDPEPVVEPAGSRPRTLAESEREEIRAALAYTRGHQGRAAELLGISRKNLWEKRKRYGIP